jgi:cell pole-organizing protein PopZ
MTPPPDNEPSIEEILDSIRQIISDEEESPAAEDAGGQPPQANDDIIELTERVAEPAKAETPAAPQSSFAEEMQIEMKDSPQESEMEPPPVPEFKPEPPPVYKAPDPVKEPEPIPAMTSQAPPSASPQPVDNLETIISRHAEAAAVKAFSELTQKAAVERGGGVTIEDVVRYEVRPLLRAWIDKYLPGIVERLLQKELERISRRFEQD